MKNPALRFGLVFVVSLGVFSLLFQLPAVDDYVVQPMMVASAHASGFLLGLAGMETRVEGTSISLAGGSPVDIKEGCDGSYVTAIVISAVLAFPCRWMEKLIGLVICAAGVQVINLARICHLAWLQTNDPESFEEFHLYVWQTVVIVLSMALWILWAQLLAGRRPGGPAPPARPARAGGATP